MFASVNKKTRIASVAALLALVSLAIVLVVDYTPSNIDDIKETSKGVSQDQPADNNNDNDFWLKQSDPMTEVLEHEDDTQVQQAAADADVKNGVMSKAAMDEAAKEALKEAKQVDTDMKKEVITEKAEAAHDKKEQEETENTIREIYDLAYHQKRQNERRAKKLKAERKAERKRLATLKRVARTEVLFKQDCKTLEKIMTKAVPAQRAAYKKTCKGLKRL